MYRAAADLCFDVNWFLYLAEFTLQSVWCIVTLYIGSMESYLKFHYLDHTFTYSSLNEGITLMMSNCYGSMNTSFHMHQDWVPGHFCSPNFFKSVAQQHFLPYLTSEYARSWDMYSIMSGCNSPSVGTSWATDARYTAPSLSWSSTHSLELLLLCDSEQYNEPALASTTGEMQTPKRACKWWLTASYITGSSKWIIC